MTEKITRNGKRQWSSKRSRISKFVDCLTCRICILAQNGTVKPARGISRPTPSFRKSERLCVWGPVRKLAGVKEIKGKDAVIHWSLFAGDKECVQAEVIAERIW